MRNVAVNSGWLWTGLVLGVASSPSFGCRLTDLPEAQIKSKLRTELIHVLRNDASAVIRSARLEEIKASDFTRPKVSALIDPGPRCERMEGVFHTSAFHTRVRVQEGTCQVRGTANLMGSDLFHPVKIDYEISCIGEPPTGPSGTAVINPTGINLEGEWVLERGHTSLVSDFRVMPLNRYINLKGSGIPSMSTSLYQEGQAFRVVIQITSQSREITLNLRPVDDRLAMTWTDRTQTPRGPISSTGRATYYRR